MTAYQAVGYLLAQTSAISAIVSSRISFGMRPDGDTYPCINYYNASGGQRFWGMEREVFSINCRATSASAAFDLARLVVNLFGGSSGTGIYGEASSFSITRACVVQSQGVIPEPGDLVFNAPVDVQLVYPIDTVS